MRAHTHTHRVPPDRSPLTVQYHRVYNWFSLFRKLRFVRHTHSWRACTTLLCLPQDMSWPSEHRWLVDVGKLRQMAGDQTNQKTVCVVCTESYWYCCSFEGFAFLTAICQHWLWSANPRPTSASVHCGIFFILFPRESFTVFKVLSCDLIWMFFSFVVSSLIDSDLVHTFTCILENITFSTVCVLAFGPHKRWLKTEAFQNPFQGEGFQKLLCVDVKTGKQFLMSESSLLIFV